MSDDAARSKALAAGGSAAGGTAEAFPGRETASFEAFLDEFAAAFAGTKAADVDSEVEKWLKRLVEFFGADRCSLAEFSPSGTFLVTHSWARPGYELATGIREIDVPWLVAKVRRGEMVVYSGPDDLPPEATKERLIAQRVPIKAHVSLPLMRSGKPIGSLGIACIQRSRRWSPVVLQRLRLIGTVFGSALERRRAEQEHLQISRKLEHAGRVAAIGQLASSFAHEINQPLGASLTNAQTALRLLDAPHPDLAEIRASLADIAADNRRAGEIVHELRRFLRRQEPSLSAIAVEDLFETVVRFVTPEARNQGIEIRIDAADGVSDVLADRVQIQQVFVNLLLNAFDALSAKAPGQRRVLLAAAPGPWNRIAVSVSDSGPGVPAHLRASLFEPFVTTKPQGLGLGLAIAQTIIASHGSLLEYSDARDGGAVFTFSLAAAPQRT